MNKFTKKIAALLTSCISLGTFNANNFKSSASFSSFFGDSYEYVEFTQDMLDNVGAENIYRVLDKSQGEDKKRWIIITKDCELWKPGGAGPNGEGKVYYVPNEKVEMIENVLKASRVDALFKSCQSGGAAAFYFRLPVGDGSKSIIVYAQNVSGIGDRTVRVRLLQSDGKLMSVSNPAHTTTKAVEEIGENDHYLIPTPCVINIPTLDQAYDALSMKNINKDELMKKIKKSPVGALLGWSTRKKVMAGLAGWAALGTITHITLGDRAVKAVLSRQGIFETNDLDADWENDLR